MLTIADVALPNIIPIIKRVIISFILKETNRIINKIIAEPIQAAITIIQLPAYPMEIPVNKPAKPNTMMATPKLAPALIPRTKGPARGFLNMVCICNPLTDNADPANIAVITLGILIFHIIDSHSLVEPLKIVLTISENGIFTDPNIISSTKKHNSKSVNVLNINMFLDFIKTLI